MIRLIQRKLIIPRGDTGSFSVPTIASATNSDVAVFTIFDCLTRTKVFEQETHLNNGQFTIIFSHNDTVNLPCGKYYWDIKFYKNPVYADGHLINGDEVDSYYAGYNLAECEIRPTGDNLLISPDAPSGTLTPEQLDIINAAVTETQTNVTHYPYVGEDGYWYTWDATTNQFVNTGTSAVGPGIAAGGTTGNVLLKKSDVDYDTEWGEIDITVKADKVNNATEGNFASLNSEGNLVDSGKTSSDFLSSSTIIPDISGKADKVSGATEGDIATLDATGNLVDSGKKPSDFILSSTKGAVNGVAELGSDGKVPSAQLPSYVDDVVEYASEANFPATGESGKIYVALDTNLTYRWSGSAYIEISPSLALGETSSTAYRGDYGATAYAHAVTNKGTNYTSGLYKITTNSEGHVTNAAAVEKSDITVLGIPAQDTTYESKSAANGGTDVSLVTTGEKYGWNSKVDDVQVNGTSVVTNGVANVPKATSSTLGTVMVQDFFGIGIASDGRLYLFPGSEAEVKNGTNLFHPIVPSKQDWATFYGLAKAAGDSTQSVSDNAVGTYTDAAKAAIQHMIGTDAAIAPYESDITADQAYVQNETFMMDGKLYKASSAIAQGDILTPGTNCAETKISEAFLHDVQVNGTSVVSNGVANIPIASSVAPGVIKVVDNTSGLYKTSANELRVASSTDAAIKAGNNDYRPIVSANQHKSVFYGLAKAAGDSTQSASSNAVGTYTDNAKASIKAMLGVVDASTDVTISGTTPSITATANTRYLCGEVTSISFAPSATGICEVIFTSGTTAAILTLPNTVKLPAWFDATSLDTNTIYDISIVDGVYGAVMTWAT